MPYQYLLWWSKLLDQLLPTSHHTGWSVGDLTVSQTRSEMQARLLSPVSRLHCLPPPSQSPVIVSVVPLRGRDCGGPVGQLHGAPGTQTVLQTLLQTLLLPSLIPGTLSGPDCPGGAAQLRLLQARPPPLLPRRATQGLPCEGAANIGVNFERYNAACEVQVLTKKQKPL